MGLGRSNFVSRNCMITGHGTIEPFHKRVLIFMGSLKFLDILLDLVPVITNRFSLPKWEASISLSTNDKMSPITVLDKCKDALAGSISLAQSACEKLDDKDRRCIQWMLVE